MTCDVTSRRSSRPSRRHSSAPEADGARQRLGRPRAGGLRPRRRRPSYVARRARGAIEAGEHADGRGAEDDLIRRAIAAYFHAGKFQALLDLDGVTDIMVNAHDTIWLQRIDGRSSAIDESRLRRRRRPARRGRPPRPPGGWHGAPLRRRQAAARPAPARRLAARRDHERLAGAAGGDPPQRAARRHRSTSSSSAARSTGRCARCWRRRWSPGCASSCRARPAPARRRCCGR